MPHLIIERSRAFPSICTCTFQTRKDFPAGAYFIEVLDILAAVIFIAGSVCFLPAYSHDLQVFLLGCVLFVVGSAVYVGICLFTFFEALKEKGLMTLEASENFMYLVGSWLYLVGTFLYWPAEGHYKEMADIKELSLGQYFNFFEPEFEGTVLFAVGSVLFAFAAFVNALNIRHFDDWTSIALSAITSLYMGGSLLFAMGSVAFLPNLGCGEQMIAIGAWCFIIGSVLFLIGSLLSFWRTWHILGSPAERAPLDSRA